MSESGRPREEREGLSLAEGDNITDSHQPSRGQLT